jgi:hypothetical protein
MLSFLLDDGGRPALTVLLPGWRLPSVLQGGSTALLLSAATLTKSGLGDRENDLRHPNPANRAT